jgi:hypothetical protein
MEEPIGKIIFGCKYVQDKDFFDLDKRSYDDDIKVSVLISELMKFYPICLNVSLPSSFRLADTNNGEINFSNDDISISKTIKPETNLLEYLKDSFNYYYNIFNVYNIENVNIFGFRVISFIDNLNVLNLFKCNYEEFLLEKKIYDKNTKHHLSSNKFYFFKNNKEYILRIEPSLKDSSKAFIDFQVNVKQNLPVVNIFEILKQEIEHYLSIIENFKN